MTDQDIINVVDPIAAKYGVPTLIWETVAEVESGLNPRAVGDHGTSFGLFQLHRGGQLGNLTPEQAYDPATNAEQAMPAIAKAWKNLAKGADGPSVTPGGSAPGSYNWWYKFAVLSGHPGADSGGANSATQVEARKLQQESNVLQVHPLPPSQAGTNTNQPGRQPYDTSSILDGWLQNTIVAPLQSGAVKVALFCLALVLLIAGLYAISRK